MKTRSHSSPAAHPLVHAALAACVLKYPEFAGNVISIDTSSACRPPAQSPGGRDRYKGNAESYLAIGEAMGEALLRMLEGNNWSA